LSLRDNPSLPDPEMAGSKFRKKTTIHAVRMSHPFTVNTIEGIHTGKEGDWLAKGAAGELYPIDAKIFEKTYELAEDEK